MVKSNRERCNPVHHRCRGSQRSAGGTRRCGRGSLADNTLPSSREWDGTDSGLRISDISGQGTVIGFRTGPESEVISLSKAPDLVIPDDDPEGVTSTLTAVQGGSLRSIRVRVDITHTYRGDLVVDVVSPAGTEARLHEKRGGDLDDVHLDFTSDDHEQLAKFVVLKGPGGLLGGVLLLLDLAGGVSIDKVGILCPAKERPQEGSFHIPGSRAKIPLHQALEVPRHFLG